MYLQDILPRTALLYPIRQAAPRGGTVTLRCAICAPFTWSSNYFQISARQVVVFTPVCPECHGYRNDVEGRQAKRKGIVVAKSFRDYADVSSTDEERVLVVERRYCQADEYEWVNGVSAACPQGHYLNCDFCGQPGEILELKEPHRFHTLLWVRHETAPALFCR